MGRPGHAISDEPGDFGAYVRVGRGRARYEPQLTAMEFENRTVTDLAMRDATPHCATVGFAYRPNPRWVASLAGRR